jgi:hypothetical protein
MRNLPPRPFAPLGVRLVDTGHNNASKYAWNTRSDTRAENRAIARPITKQDRARCAATLRFHRAPIPGYDYCDPALVAPASLEQAVPRSNPSAAWIINAQNGEGWLVPPGRTRLGAPCRDPGVRRPYPSADRLIAARAREVALFPAPQIALGVFFASQLYRRRARPALRETRRLPTTVAGDTRDKGKDVRAKRSSSACSWGRERPCLKIPAQVAQVNTDGSTRIRETLFRSRGLIWPNQGSFIWRSTTGSTDRYSWIRRTPSSSLT